MQPTELAAENKWMGIISEFKFANHLTPYLKEEDEMAQ